MTHTFTQILDAPEGQIRDSGNVLTARASLGADETVSANGGAANTVSIAVAAAALVSLGMLSSVPCVVTLTGATVIDGVMIGTVTLAAGVVRQVKAVTGDITGISVGANTTGAGAAGTISFRLLYNT